MVRGGAPISCGAVAPLRMEHIGLSFTNFDFQ